MPSEATLASTSSLFADRCAQQGSALYAFLARRIAVQPQLLALAAVRLDDHLAAAAPPWHVSAESEEGLYLRHLADGTLTTTHLLPSTPTR